MTTTPNDDQPNVRPVSRARDLMVGAPAGAPHGCAPVSSPAREDVERVALRKVIREHTIRDRGLADRPMVAGCWGCTWQGDSSGHAEHVADMALAALSARSPADVERVARVVAEHDTAPDGSLIDGDSVVSCRCGETFTGWTGADEHVARAVLAALSARPVEAQGTDEGEVTLLAQAWAAEARKEREAHTAALARAEAAEGRLADMRRDLGTVAGIRDDIKAERDAALARATSWEAEADRLAQVAGDEHRRAEAAEALIEKVRALADGWRADGPTDTEPGLAIFLDRLRALLDGDSEGRESGQPVAQEGEEEDPTCHCPTPWRRHNRTLHTGPVETGGEGR